MYDIRLNLDIQMNLASDIACRNPKIKALQEKYNNELFTDELYRKEFDRLFKEIYGEVFPRAHRPSLDPADPPSMKRRCHRDFPVLLRRVDEPRC